MKSLNFLKENKSEVVSRIAELIENMLGGDLINVYFYLTGGDDIVNYSFNGNSNTICTITAQSQKFYKYDCDGYVDEETIEYEIDRFIDENEGLYL